MVLRKKKRLSIAPGSLLFDSAPSAADLIFIACSSGEALKSALEQLEPGGTIILFSGMPEDAKKMTINHNNLHRKEQTLVGSYGCRPGDMAQALNLLSQGDVSIDELVTKTLPLSMLGNELARKTDHNDFKTIISL